MTEVYLSSRGATAVIHTGVGAAALLQPLPGVVAATTAATSCFTPAVATAPPPAALTIASILLLDPLLQLL